MDYNIVVGSSCDFDEKYGEEINYSKVPFTITIDDVSYEDNEEFTVDKIVEKNEKFCNNW